MVDAPSPTGNMFQILATALNCPKASRPSNGVLHNKDMKHSSIQDHGTGKVQHRVDGQCERGLDHIVINGVGSPDAEILRIHC